MYVEGIRHYTILSFMYFSADANCVNVMNFSLHIEERKLHITRYSSLEYWVRMLLLGGFIDEVSYGKAE